MAQAANNLIKPEGKTDEGVTVDKKTIIQALQTLEGLKRKLHSWLKET